MVIRLFGPVVSLSPTWRTAPAAAGIDLPDRTMVTLPLTTPAVPADVCAHIRGADASKATTTRLAESASFLNPGAAEAIVMLFPLFLHETVSITPLAARSVAPFIAFGIGACLV